MEKIETWMETYLPGAITFPVLFILYAGMYAIVTVLAIITLVLCAIFMPANTTRKLLNWYRFGDWKLP